MARQNIGDKRLIALLQRVALKRLPVAFMRAMASVVRCRAVMSRPHAGDSSTASPVRLRQTRMISISIGLLAWSLLTVERRT